MTMFFEPESTDVLDDDFVVVIGVFAPREFEVARTRYRSLASTTFEAYAKDTEAMAQSMIGQGAEVEFCVLDIEDYDDWCLANEIDPDRTDSRAKYVATLRPETYPFDTSIMRVFDCEYATYLAHWAYADLLEPEDALERADALDDACMSLMDSVGATLQGQALVSVEAVVGDDEPEFGMSFVAAMDTDHDLCLVHESDHMALSAILHVGLLRGGTVYVRELTRDGCVLRGYDLGSGQWAAGSAADTAAWRGERDASVAVAGGLLTLQNA
jgi:hypothetical protein